MESHKVIAKGLARSFASSEGIPKMLVTAHIEDEKGHVDSNPVATTTTQADGQFQLKTPVVNELILNFIHWFYHPTVKCGIDIPASGINDQNPLKNLAMQVPDWLSIYCFALAMGAPPSKDGYIQGVSANVIESGTLLWDFPHGLPGVTVELIFDDPQLQEKWIALQKLDKANKKFNEQVDNSWIHDAIAITTSLAATSFAYRKTEVSPSQKLNIVLFTLAIALATKAITAIIAWRYYKQAVTTFYWDVWKSLYLKGYTYPGNNNLDCTSDDAGVFINLRNLPLPENGARFKLVAKKPGYEFNTVRGHAFKNKITIFTHPQTITAKPHPNDREKLKPGELEEKGRPARLVKSLAIGSGAAIATYFKSQQIVKAMAAGTLSAPIALFCLEGLYKRTINPLTIFGAPQFKPRVPPTPNAPGNALVNHNYFNP